MNYEQVKAVLLNYIEECRTKIKNLTFTDKQLKESIHLKNSLIRKGKISDDSTIEGSIKFHREEYLDIKLRHSLRVVDMSVDIARKMHLDEKFIELLKCAAILHDIGRFDQTLWSNNFMDIVYNDKNPSNPYRKKKISSLEGKDALITNHDRAGYYILFEEGKIKDYPIDSKYYPAIGDTIYHHGEAYLPKHLDLDLSTVLKEGLPLTLSISVISAALVQIIRDADKIDVLYQCTTSDINVIREDFSYPIKNDKLEDISQKFGLSYSEILEWNGITNEEFETKKRISIPLKNVDPNLLKIDSTLRKRLLSNNIPTLKELANRQDQHFITTIWWRITAFLNDIIFLATLLEINDSHLLDKIYEQYPDIYKPLIDEVFNFAKQKLIMKPIIDNKDNIYIKKTTSILT